MSEYSLNGIKITTSEFLEAFFAPDETVCLRVFSDKADNAFTGQKIETQQAHFDSIIDTLQKHNKKNRGIYFVINHGGHEDNQINRINAHFMECDNLSLEEQLEKIKEFALEPSLIVKTRKSLHCYWLMKKASLERFRTIQKKLILHFNADPACINESRVFRLPNFYHCKEEPVLVECIKYNPELRYTADELEKVLPNILEEPTPAPVKNTEHGTQKGLVATGKRCSFLQYCKRNAKSLSEPLWYAMITNLAVFEGGESAIHKLSSPYKNYSYEKTQAKIEHFLNSNTKPITCKRIAEQGFVCPKMKNNSCHCKSPAGLAFIPLDLPQLKKALEKIKLNHDVTANILQTEQFVKDYLYNVSQPIADAFISEDIKAYFGFKANNIKTLLRVQKKLFDEFSKLKETIKSAPAEELPPWYEITKQGGLKFLPGVLADYLAENENAIYCADSYYFYEDGVYNPHNDKTAQRRVRSFMDSKHSTASEIRDSEFQWQILIDKTTREINVNPYLLNFENGMYNLQTDELSPHNPQILSTIRLGGSYNPEAICPKFLWYLGGVLPKSEFPLIQEILGYFLAPINKAQKSFVMVGKPDSGKSTLLYVVQDLLLRQENVSNLTWQELDEKFATVQLFGKLANIFADLPSSDIRDTGTFKAITGEDYISAQHKFKEYFSFKPFARLLFSCNSIPKNYSDRSDGFYRRLILIRFDHSISDDKKDQNLKEKLKAETDGIIAWAMVGLKRLIENNYRFSETERTKAELSNYKADNSSTLAFIGECCEINAESEVLREELYNAYLEYCSATGLKAFSQKKFNAEVDGIAGVKRNMEAVTRRRTWSGIKIM